MSAGISPSAGDLRALFGRKRVPIYFIASAIRVHPSRLSRLLNERAPLDPDLAARILEALDAWPDLFEVPREERA